MDMPSRLLRRSSSPRKNVATLWLFRGRVCGKAGCPVENLSLRAIPQDGAAIRTLTGHEGKDKGLIYLYPPATLLGSFSLRKSGQCYRQLFVIEAWEA